MRPLTREQVRAVDLRAIGEYSLPGIVLMENAGRNAAHLLMAIHEGEWLKPFLGSASETAYVLLNGLGLLSMLISGAAMLTQSLRRQWQRAQSKQGS